MMHTTDRILVVLTFLSVVAGCSRDGSGPTAAHYRLFVGPPAYSITQGHGPGFYAFDTENDSLVDSSFVCSSADDPSSFYYTFFVGAKDGSYLAAACEGKDGYTFLDATTLSVLGTTPVYVDELFLDPAAGLAVGLVWPATDIEIIEIASLPGGEILARDTIFTPEAMDSLDIKFMMLTRIDTHRGVVYGYVEYGRQTSNGMGSALIGYDYRHRRVAGIWPINPDFEEGLHEIGMRFALSPDGRRAYVVGDPLPGGHRLTLMCYDLVSDSLVFRVPCECDLLAYLEVTPDGKQVYVSQPRRFDSPWPGKQTLAVLDADNGALVGEVPLDTLRPSAGYLAAFPKQMRFVPGTSKCYLASGESAAGLPGRVAVIDTRQFKIVGIIAVNFGYNTSEFVMEVVPVN